MVASVSRQSLLSLLIYLTAFIPAFVIAWASVGIYTLLALFYALPIEHPAGEAEEAGSLYTQGVKESEG